MLQPENPKGKLIWKAAEASKCRDAPSGKIMNKMSNPDKDFTKAIPLAFQRKGEATYNGMQSFSSDKTKT